MEDDLLRWLHDNGTPEAVRVTGLKEVTDYEVGCGEGTCVYEVTAVKIYFIDNKGDEDYDVYEGEFTKFIRELTKEV